MTPLYVKIIYGFRVRMDHNRNMMICIHLIKRSCEVISCQTSVEEETVLAIAFLRRVDSELKLRPGNTNIFFPAFFVTFGFTFV
jgi:hypothetical protein